MPRRLTSQITDPTVFDAAERVAAKHLSGLLPSGERCPLPEIRAALAPGEVLAVYDWCDPSVTLAVVTGVDDGEPRSFRLADAAVTGTDVTRIEHARAAAAHCRGCLVGEQSTAGLVDASRDLLAFALPPEARAMLARAGRVVIIPAGPLHDLPLDVLAETAGVAELSCRPVVTAPSASAYAMLKGRPAGDGPYLPCIIGDPEPDVLPGQASGEGGVDEPDTGSTRSEDSDQHGSGVGRPTRRLRRLPWARATALHVAATYSKHLGADVQALVGAAATTDAVYSYAGRKRVIHFSAHSDPAGLTDPSGPAIMLAPSHKTESSVARLGLDALRTRWVGRLIGCDLVVLSCCSSARGVDSGNGRLTLPIAFLHAGARCVMASLWDVGDLPSWLLMRRFHENLLGEHTEVRLTSGRAYRVGEPMDAWSALAEARRFVRELTFKRLTGEIGLAGGPASESERGWLDRCHRHGVEHPFIDPMHWAAFVLIGAVG